METTIKVQFYIFLTSIYGGLIAGIFYDIYRISRYYFKPKKIATIIEDALFWIGVALIFFYILNKSNWTELRVYVFIGFFGGGIIYLNILSKFLSPFLLKLFGGIITIFNSIGNFLALPFKHLKKSLKPKILKINKLKRIPKEAVCEIKRYKKIISKKK